MTRGLGEHGENEEPQLAVVEGPPATAPPFVMRAAMPPMMAVRMMIAVAFGMEEMRVAPVMMIVFHDSDIYRDMFAIKIYRNIFRAAGIVLAGALRKVEQSAAVWSARAMQRCS
ncbi:hypothetical protein GCM10011390_04750 [Aureimonas endophytica]|uniref:Uncharacterized protein n=1 Tax=Aureimonas endophytica TaxID=2027858 RepID=A0A916ZD71_9HYPH|nr:hypothetical protein GCM10011390_04750 [Aureimonas endophytica]